MKHDSNSGRRINTLFALVLGLTAHLSCQTAFSSPETSITGTANKESGATDGMQQVHQHAEPAYTCPMHPDEVSDKPGSCSQCGMFLVAQEMPESKNDHAMHNHAAPDSSGKPAANMPDEGMPHGQMRMPPKTKPALFWESSQSQQTGMTSHNQAEPVRQDHPIPKRMTPEDPMSSSTTQQVMSESPAALTGKHQEPTYICPMHPQIVSQDPGSSCPICGMDLVSKENTAPAGDHPQVFLSGATIQNMGVRIAKVERRSLEKKFKTQGIVTADDERIRNIHPRAGGWVKTLYLLTEGDRIERKDVLMDFYSPWINQEQIEFIEALEAYDMVSFDPSHKTELAAKVDAKRNALRLLNVSSMDVMRIENSRKVQSTIQLMAPRSGLVTELNVREGTYVEPYQRMFTIVDLSEVWIMVNIYEHQAPWVRKGTRVEISAPAIPGRTWGGKIDFIYPEVDPKTRTLRARIEVANPDEALLLNMFVQVDLSSSAMRHDVLALPREAVIVTGEREVVVLLQGKGHFQPVEVTTGTWSNNQAEILTGLKEGDEVVVSGQFLIDSESSLQASFLRMSE